MSNSLEADSLNTLSAEEYVRDRLAVQISYHNQKAVASKHAYRRLLVLSVTATSLTPLLLALEMIYSPPPHDDPVQLIFEILPIAVAVLAAAATITLAAFRQKDVWALHRMTCESLEREVQLFRYRAGPYAGVAAPVAVLVQRAETIMESENETWQNLL